MKSKNSMFTASSKMSGTKTAPKTNGSAPQKGMKPINTAKPTKSGRA